VYLSWLVVLFGALVTVSLEKYGLPQQQNDE
jgi:uncharacterized BrkB/YihY/UPF0761 family membrane protein